MKKSSTYGSALRAGQTALSALQTLTCLAAGAMAISVMPSHQKENAALVSTNAEEASEGPLSVWYPQHGTTFHTKVPGLGYSEGVKPELTSPYYDPDTRIPVSTTMKCIMYMAVQYFFIYTAKAVLRTVRQVNRQNVPSKAELTVQAATGTVAFVPMLSCLFLGVRMRAVQLSQNETEKYNLPQDWVQSCMYLCSTAILVQVVLVLVVPFVTGKTPETDTYGNLIVSNTGAPGSRAGAPAGSSSMFATVATVIRFAAMAALYVGMIAVSMGAFMMEGPEEIWGKKTPPVSPAVFVTMNMCYLYFFIYSALAVLRALGRQQYDNLIELFKICAFCVNLAPMMCVLFIGARMRALQIDPMHGAPQAWAQNCFYLCMWSLYIQCFLVLVVGLFIGGKIKQGPCEGDVTFENIANPMVLSVISALRWILLLALYGGLLAVIVSVATIEHPDGAKFTPELSTAMICVMNLTIQYFFVYIVLYVLVTVRQFAGPDVLTKTINAFDAARGTVMFCPMLCILFVGLRMRALQITGGSGAPQGWAQDCMYAATWSVFLQLVLCLGLPCVTGDDVVTDDDGNVKTTAKAGAGLYILEGLRYLCMLSMYGGATGVAVALMVMVPATANGHGSYGIPKPVNIHSAVNGTVAATPSVPSVSIPNPLASSDETTTTSTTTAGATTTTTTTTTAAAAAASMLVQKFFF